MGRNSILHSFYILLDTILQPNITRVEIEVIVGDMKDLLRELDLPERR